MIQMHFLYTKLLHLPLCSDIVGARTTVASIANGGKKMHETWASERKEMKGRMEQFGCNTMSKK
jgi:hypothetical protein